jgi:hypothetical protein
LGVVIIVFIMVMSQTYTGSQAVLNMQNLLGNFGAAGGANFNFTVVQQIS